MTSKLLFLFFFVLLCLRANKFYYIIGYDLSVAKPKKTPQTLKYKHGKFSKITDGPAIVEYKTTVNLNKQYQTGKLIIIFFCKDFRQHLKVF